MIIFLVYLIQGNHFEQVLDYLYTNWFEMVKPLKTSDYKKQESGDDLDQPSVLYHIDNDNQQDSLNLRDNDETVVPTEEEEVGPSERHVHSLKLYVINCS